MSVVARAVVMEGHEDVASEPDGMRIETLYGRDLHAEKRTIRTNATHIGFFGNHPFSYEALAAGRDISALSETGLMTSR